MKRAQGNNVVATARVNGLPQPFHEIHVVLSPPILVAAVGSFGIFPACDNVSNLSARDPHKINVHDKYVSDSTCIRSIG